jgi:hypothetical protein
MTPADDARWHQLKQRKVQAAMEREKARFNAFCDEAGPSWDPLLPVLPQTLSKRETPVGLLKLP